MGKTITIKATDGSGEFSGYLALPAAGHGPGVVIGQEIFGVNPNIRAVADRFATEGYVVLAPELFWRLERDVQLSYEGEDLQRAFSFMHRFDIDKGVEDIATTLETLRDLPEVDGEQVAFVGFCLGGKLAYLTAARTDIACSIGYYGVEIDKYLDEAANIHGHLLLHFAELDKLCDAAARERIDAVLGSMNNVDIHVYPGVDHAFARVNGSNYQKESAELAHQRTLAALKHSIGPTS